MYLGGAYLYIIIESTQRRIGSLQCLVNGRPDLLGGWVEDRHGARLDDAPSKTGQWLYLYQQTEQLRNLRDPRVIGDCRLSYRYSFH